MPDTVDDLRLTDSLALRLLRSVFGAYSLVTLLVTGIQVYADYRHAEQRMNQDIAALERTFGPGIADAVWGLNEDVLSGILSGMIELPDVIGAQVIDERGTLVGALGIISDAGGAVSKLDAQGHSEPARGHNGFLDMILSRDFDLVHTDAHGHRHIIGHWTVYSERGVIIRQVEQDLGVVLFSAALKTIGLWFIFLMVIHGVIGRPLRQLSAQVGQLNINNLGSTPIVLRDRGRHELHLLARMLNLMTGKIRKSVEENTQLLQDLQEMNATLQSRVEARTRELEVMATTDQLTSLVNRRKLDDALEYERRRAERLGSALSVIICDIDRFKSVNDEHGHQAGDLVLTAFSHLLRAAVRSMDIAGRWGGEEFLVICPNTNLAEAVVLAERIRKSVAAATFPVVGSKTCSFGVAELGKGETADDVIGRADAALYGAKASGRNQVALAPRQAG